MTGARLAASMAPNRAVRTGRGRGSAPRRQFGHELSPLHSQIPRDDETDDMDVVVIFCTQRDRLADALYVDGGLQRRPRSNTVGAPIQPTLQRARTFADAERQQARISIANSVTPIRSSATQVPSELTHALGAIEYATGMASPCHLARDVAPMTDVLQPEGAAASLTASLLNENRKGT